MNYQGSLFLAFIFFIQLADFLALGQGPMLPDEQCLDKGNYTSNSTYTANLNITLSSLSTKIDSNGFSYVSVGQGIDRANGIVLCRGDVQLDACLGCVKRGAAELLKSCPTQKQAIHWDENCMLRYSNETMYAILATWPRSESSNPENATSPDQFKKDLRMLLNDLQKKAASGGPLRKMAAGNVTGPDFQTIFGLVQCTPDLPPEDCTSCLFQAAAYIPRCCDRKTGGRVLMPSCNLRFDIYPFFNETRLQELESASLLPSSPGKGNGNTPRTAIIIVVSIAACLILAVFLIILLTKRKKQRPIGKQRPTGNPETVGEISTNESLQYTFSTIKAATNDFSDDSKLGQGGFGAVYKGELQNGQKVAVKRLSRYSGQGDLEFKNEVLLLSKLQHRNLVRLLGFALEGAENLLIYEFVQNASLDHFIFDPVNHSYLDWDRRYKIIVGIAKGVLYLHEDSHLRVIHRDLKVSNILLDREMNPKISDFGMARLFGQDETQGNTSRVVGTHGYMAPEYLLYGQFSIKTDVFSFGVMVLEIISGQKNNSFQSGETVMDLLSFAWKNWRDGAAENVVDPFLRSSSGASGSMRHMLRCIHIGLLCVQEKAADRPTMASVVLMLGSFCTTLAIPCEPAFYCSSGYGSDVSRLHEYNSGDPEYNNLSRPADQSDHSSQNDASVTEWRVVSPLRTHLLMC